MFAMYLFEACCSEFPSRKSHNRSFHLFLSYIPSSCSNPLNFLSRSLASPAFTLLTYSLFVTLLPAILSMWLTILVLYLTLSIPKAYKNCYTFIIFTIPFSITTHFSQLRYLFLLLVSLIFNFHITPTITSIFQFVQDINLQ